MNLKTVCSSTILVVDDAPSNLQVLFACLENAGFRVLIARTGKKALAIAESVRPDLILLDILMPDLDGYETCLRLKRHIATREIPVIFMTAYSDTVDRVRCFDVGGVDYISKPFQVEEVLARIKHQLTIRSLQKQLQQQNAELEQRVKERTAELVQLNQTLEQRVQQRTAELERARTKAEAASSAKSEFLAKMTHELRTPLNAILGFAQILNRHSSWDTEQQEQLEIILHSGEHLLALINDILELSKIEAGKTELYPAPLDLYRLLDSLKQMFQLKAADKSLQLNFAIDSAVPQYICTDEGKLRQVLINLLGNALKFTDRGSVTLCVSSGVRSQESGVETFHETSVQEFRSSGVRNTPPLPLSSPSSSPSPSLQFSVRDTGRGIAPEDLERIFEAFTQSGGHSNIEGTGLGLAISKHFIELMNGSIAIASSSGEGTTVTFEVEVASANAEDVPQKLPHQRAIALAENQPETRILVVEDHWESRKLVVQLLSSLGFVVFEAANGQDAIALWEECNPALIVMDLRMPVMDGFEATQKIKATLKGQAIAIIALTATVLSENKQLILSAGFDDIICKPFREAVLLETIAQHLGLRYVYETYQPATPSVEKPTRLSPEALQVMPPQWLAQLHQAALSCDREEITALLSGIPTLHKTLQKQLGHLVGEFDFPAIAQLVESCLESA